MATTTEIDESAGICTIRREQGWLTVVSQHPLNGLIFTRNIAHTGEMSRKILYADITESVGKIRELFAKVGKRPSVLYSNLYVRHGRMGEWSYCPLSKVIAMSKNGTRWHRRKASQVLEALSEILGEKLI